MKKVLLIIGIIIISVLIFFIYTTLNSSTKIISKSITSIPTNASMIIETSNFSSLSENLTKNNKYWNDLLDIEYIKNLNNQIIFFNNIINKNEDYKTYIKENPVLISSHSTGNNKFNFLFTLNVSLKITKEIIENEINAVCKKNNYQVNKRDYNNNLIKDVLFKNKKIFSYSFTNGVFIISKSSILIEDAIRQSKSKNSLLNNKGFLKVQKTAGKSVDANIYLNLKYFPRLVSLFLKNPHKKHIRNFSNFGNWSEFDLNLEKDLILLNGFTYSNDSINNYANIFLNQQSISYDIDDILPSNTSAFAILGISNINKYNTDYKDFLQSEGKLINYKNRISSINKTYNVNIEELFFPVISNQVALAYTNINNLDIGEYTFSIIKTVSKSTAENNLLEIINSKAKQDGKTINDYIFNYKIDDETTYKIYKFPIHNFTSTLLGGLFSTSETNYFTFYDNYLIFGKSIKSLSNYIHDNILQKTLKSNIDYQNFKDDLSSKTNFYFYSNIISASPLLYNYFTKEVCTDFEKNFKSLRKLQSLAYQFSSNDNMLYNNILIKYNPVFKEKPHTVWESHLDTILETKPTFVINHNTNKKEIFIQDLNNNIYLINKEGRILWKTKLNEKINSEIYQIDYYKNNKLQYMFSTKSSLHILDRNGNYVERYPIKLKSPTTAGMSLVDYDNNRNYRIFVPTIDKSIYLYNIEGNILPGWTFDKTEHVVKKPIQFFKIGDKDYIIFADTLKTYIVNRKGETRIDVKTPFIKSKNNIFYLNITPNPDDSYFLTTNSTGEIVKINLNGDVSTTKIKNFSNNHYFDFEDINGNGIKDYIFVNENNLSIFNQNKKSILEYEFEDNISEKPVIYSFSATDIKIGIVSKTKNQIFLINNDGTLYDDFPLSGKTLFSISHFTKNSTNFNLIVGSNDSFLYNYEVQ